MKIPRVFKTAEAMDEFLREFNDRVSVYALALGETHIRLRLLYKPDGDRRCLIRYLGSVVGPVAKRNPITVVPNRARNAKCRDQAEQAASDLRKLFRYTNVQVATKHPATVVGESKPKPRPTSAKKRKAKK